ncbi:tyrosine-type recombinase/integrase, partial [Mesorhizobium sp.]|uniref:tyrosine-type recombinase/integrase n=2 Tax=Mesorhizobium TaxID=68287 RepID=UPI00257F5763
KIESVLQDRCNPDFFNTIHPLRTFGLRSYATCMRHSSLSSFLNGRVRVLGKTALPRIRFHDLRHTHATQMLSAGVHPKVASERLGHSTIGITLDLYSHVMPGMQADAAEQVDAALQVAISASRKTI